MMNFKFFLLICLGFLVPFSLFHYIEKSNFEKEYFANDKHFELRQFFVKLPPEDFSEVKLKFALNFKVDIGIFGNSRSIGINKKIFSENKSFFNFSIYGSSFRSSVSMIELLDRKNKLPEKIIINFDNFIISSPKSYLCQDRIKYRLKRIFVDTRFLIKKNEYKYSLINFLNFVSSEGDCLKNKFNLARIKNLYLMFFTKDEELILTSKQIEKDHGIVLYKDGSQSQEAKEKVKKDTYGIESPRKLDYKFLEHDFKIISFINQKENHNIVIFVSPIEPSTHKKLRKSKDEEKFYTLCQKYKITCLDPPFLQNDNPPHWPDASHPPDKKLNEWLKNAI